MAQPAFQAKDLIERHSIAVISGNLQFYTDMSNRVMQVFGELVPAVEKYSIDECFLDLTGIPEKLAAFCQDLKHTVLQWTGLPISTGIAETKTLAKIANRLAKISAKTDGVLDLIGERWRDRALASTEVCDIWGIGRQYAKKLNRNGVMTALDLVVLEVLEALHVIPPLVHELVVEGLDQAALDDRVRHVDRHAGDMENLFALLLRYLAPGELVTGGTSFRGRCPGSSSTSRPAAPARRRLCCC